MVTLQDVGFEFGGRFLYREANWDIQRGSRTGLIGRNGTGKSTLLKLIVGDYQPTEGTLTRSSGLNIAFLNQDLLGFATEARLIDFVQEAFTRQRALEAEIEALLHQLETDQSDAVLHALAEKQEAFERLGGYELEARAHTLLAGFGFDPDEAYRPFNTFSGGWRMRGILTKMLLTDPDLLLLDEPTNHLDLPSILWLEDYLRRSGITYVVVSHDREFLRKMCDSIAEVSGGRLHLYSGDYDYYLEERTLRREIQQNAYENQQRYIRESERFINRFRAKATKASQAQSRIKALERLDVIDAPEAEEATASFTFRSGKTPGGTILTAQHLCKAYPQKVILKGGEARISRGDKIGLIGANGLGKSTVLRMLASAEEYEGKIELGHNVVQAFFAQHQLESLNVRNTILEEVQYHALEKGETFVRSVLGGFLFTGDDVKKPIGVLSGGERSRVALAKTLLSEANFLLLDEPTNHLDMPSIQVLAQALQAYDGTYIVVSHDRYFLSLITNKIWYLEDQLLKEYPGTYSEFTQWQARRAAEAAPEKPAPKAPPKPEAQAPAPPKAPKPPKANANQLKQAERAIEGLEAEIAQLKAQMADPAIATDFGKLAELQAKLDSKKLELTRHMETWVRLSEGD
ncbi:MAG: ABC-F family ATP-binding cassette domain-containing protein [Bacteroidia bacterium]|nr:ABC-F family ATP-binding cassette domain-containing protein [Bacteroidia bacterium]